VEFLETDVSPAEREKGALLHTFSQKSNNEVPKGAGDSLPG
jgi:hypothetical protein